MKPMKVKIGAIDFDVLFLPLNEEIFGDFSYINSRIRIEKNLKGPSLVDTLLHEIGHGIFAVYQLKGNKDSEERTVSVMATGYTQVLRDNEWLLPWIKKNLS